MRMAEGVETPPAKPSAQHLSSEEVQQLVAEYHPMARRLARRYSHGNSTDPDLGQVADMALFLAARRYHPDTGPFRPFAMVTVVGELKKHLRSNGWTAKVPRRIQEASISVATSSERLEQELKRSPTPAEVATETGLSLETVLISLQARNARFSTHDIDTDIASNDRTLSAVEAAIDVKQATARLSAEGRELLALRYGAELTQRQIADKLEISQSAVHRRLNNVLDELRLVMKPPTEDDQ